MVGESVEVVRGGGDEQETGVQSLNAPQPFKARWPIETPNVNRAARDVTRPVATCTELLPESAQSLNRELCNSRCTDTSILSLKLRE